MAGGSVERRVNDRSDIERFSATLRETKSFVYRHLLWLVTLSVVWFFASLPVVTLGVTTLGMYAAIHSLRDRGTVDRRYVSAVLRRHGIASVLVGIFPFVFAGGAALYLRRALDSGEFIPLAFGLFGLYVFAHAILIATVTLILLARDISLVASLREAYLLTVDHVTAVLMMALVTVILLVGTLALTAGFVLLFPTVAFSFHVLFADQMIAGGSHGGE